MKNLFYIINAIRFLCEMVSLVIFVWFGLKFNFPLNLLTGIFVPIVVLGVWGTFVAPKAKIKLGLVVKLLIGGAIFGIAFLYFYYFSAGVLPIVYIIIVLTVSILSKISDRLYPEGLYLD
ncbi:YrdB family protein [Lactococcus protaetiae]|uniref:DUF2568 domain-containing protein n=1 Tax=Lactococcus protaetiae TaxID=2592653 RepID=A0A514ZAC5_9LACT|nr:YrdB family protein [Lactococcus protaetiae]QDK71533.1 DUF2568 domain-containing protein [Lactococcus protaetiae]